MAIGPIEDKFYQNMLTTLTSNSTTDFSSKYSKNQQNIKLWPEMKKDLTEIFKTKTRDEWTSVFKGVDACVTPVLSSAEAAVVRPDSFQVSPRLMPKPVPEQLGELVDIDAVPGKNSREVLKEYGFSEEEIDAFFEEKSVM